jgi:hypothetical protein
MAVLDDIMYLVLDNDDETTASVVMLCTSDFEKARKVYQGAAPKASLYRETLSTGVREKLVVCSTCGSIK